MNHNALPRANRMEAAYYDGKIAITQEHRLRSENGQRLAMQKRRSRREQSKRDKANAAAKKEVAHAD